MRRRSEQGVFAIAGLDIGAIDFTIKYQLNGELIFLL